MPNRRDYKMKELAYAERTPCEHSPWCSGFGWAHEARLTHEQRVELGLPEFEEISYKKAVRAMRAHRKTLRDAQF